MHDNEKGLTFIFPSRINVWNMSDRILKHPLVAFRDANELSQEQAAAMVGISQAHWSRLENGMVFADPPLAKRIAELTGIDKDRLLNFGDNEQVSNAAK